MEEGGGEGGVGDREGLISILLCRKKYFSWKLSSK